MTAIVWIIETLGRIERRLIDRDIRDMERADANGQQAATWTTPKSRPAPQERAPESRDG